MKFCRVFTLRQKPTRTRLFLRLTRVMPLVAGCSLLSSRARAVERLDEAAATRQVCAAGPGAALARAQRLRGSAEVTAAGVLPNPSLVVEHQQSLRGPTERETSLGLSVPLGIGGRRLLLRDAAAVRREQAEADAQATLFESALAFREAYVRAVIEHARVEILAEHQSALDRLSTTIQGLTKGGETAGYDLLRQRAQARLHKSVLESAKARALASNAMLEAWTGREIALATMEPSALDGGAPAPSFSPNSALTTPRERSLDADSRASALEARAARRLLLPELDVFVGYRQISTGPETGHGISLGLTIPLTFFDHGQGVAARADAQRDITAALAAGLRRGQRAEVKASRIRLDGLAAALADAEKASVDALDVQAKARQLYAAGEATITELLETFRAAEEARLAQLGLAEEMATARLGLMRAAGTMFDPVLDSVCLDEGRGTR